MPSASDRATELIIETFKLNGELLAAGDRLVGDLGLTSARWQVLGAIEFSSVPLPVAHLARNMGLSRQGVQRIVNELEADGLVEFADNPHHARARLVTMTRAGKQAYSQAMTRQRPWVAALARKLDTRDVETALRVLRTLRRDLEAAGPARG
jgi:DNA-binding MarR family transcriptional regulator